MRDSIPTMAVGGERADAPIFVVGTGRSGTTLLRRMLSAHPRIHLTHELSFYVWDQLFDRGASAAELLDYFLRSFSFRWLELPAAPLRERLGALAGREEGHRIFREAMQLAAEREGKARFGDKTPSHAAHLGRLLADFPGARVIHIVRDPRGTLLSLSRMPWASASDVANALLYENDWRATEPFLEKILRLRLEDLLADPEARMREVLAFVGEDFDPAVLAHAEHPSRFPSTPPLPWLSSSGRPRGAPTAQWEGLTPLRIRRIEGLCQKSMRAYGYEAASLPGGTREPGGLRVLLSILGQIPEALRFAFHFARLGMMHRRAEAFDDPRRDRIFARLNPRAWSHYPGFVMPPPPPLLGERDGSVGSGS
ncbi:MAG: sulfotransferase [Deltaproteobacteria bacterium]|nr:sulfotransferase [Deltaproteobacteria bacterium]